MSIADSFKVFGAKQALKYVDRDFEHNAVKMCDWLIEHDKGGGVKNEATMVRNVLVDPNNNWYQLVKSIYNGKLCHQCLYDRHPHRLCQQRQIRL